MRRRISVLLCALLLVLGTVPARAVFSREDYYAMGIVSLGEMTFEDTQQAVNAFDKAGSYGEAKNCKQYAQALLEIFLMDENVQQDMEMTVYRFSLLAGKEGFALLLAENDLPSCEELITYIDARQMENAGEYAAAWHCYAGIEDVLDAMDREVDLVPLAYEQGKAAYDRGDYGEAYIALEGLKLRDSEEMYLAAAEMLGIASEEDLEPEPEEDLDPEPVWESVSIPVTVDFAWDLSEGGWDILFNGYDLPMEPEPFMWAVEAELGDPGAEPAYCDRNDYAWYEIWDSGNSNALVSFLGIPVNGTAIQVSDPEYAGEYRDIQLSLSFAIQPEDTDAVLRLIHTSLCYCYSCAYMPDGTGNWMETALDPGSAGDRAVMIEAGSFSLFYTDLSGSLPGEADEMISLYFFPEEGYTHLELIYSRSFQQKSLAEAQAGDTVTFGHFPQTLEGGDDTPIDWIVLEVVDGKALLLSKYCLDSRPYHSSYASVTWETCALRKWLNNGFYNNAFTDSEKAGIQTTLVRAGDNYKHHTKSGRNTQDNVFLLSIEETQKYFEDDAARRCIPTKYAISQGIWRNSDYVVDGQTTCCWWLRVPGQTSGTAVNISADGSVYIDGDGVNFMQAGVRPAIWIDLGADYE